jgi:hypothetical protein
MARYCRGCNRALDETGHDTDRGPRYWIDGVDSAGRGRLRYSPERRRYRCRVKLVATSPASGKELSPASPQRIKELNTRYVIEG